MKRTLLCLLGLLLACHAVPAQYAMSTPAVAKGAKVVKKAAAAPADAVCGVYLVNSPKNQWFGKKQLTIRRQEPLY